MKLMSTFIVVFFGFGVSNPINIHDYFPLSEKTKWTLVQENFFGHETLSVEISGTKAIDTVQARIMKFSNDEEMYFSFDPYGLYFYGLKNPKGTFIFDSPVGISTTQAAIGDIITSSWYVHRPGDAAAMDWGSVRAKFVNGGFPFEVLKRPYDGTLMITLQLANKLEYTFFLAKNIGIIECASPSTFGSRKMLAYQYPTSTTAVSTAAGAIHDSVSGADIQIPDNAVSGNVDLSLHLAIPHVSPPTGFRLKDKAVGVTPYSQKFLKPVVVSLPFSNDAQGLAVFRRDNENDTTWSRVNKVTFDQGMAAFETSEAGEFAIFEPDDVAIENGAKTLPQNAAFLNPKNFPNPFHSYTSIHFPNPWGNADIQVFNTRGAVVSSTYGIQGNRIMWSGEHLPSGPYIVKIRTGSMVFRRQIQLMK